MRKDRLFHHFNYDLNYFRKTHRLQGPNVCPYYFSELPGSLSVSFHKINF